MKRIISLMLSLMMFIGLLAACGGEDTTTSANTQSTTTDTTQVSSDVPQDDLYKLPIVDDTITLTAITQFRSSYMESWNDCEAFKELEKRTNVHIEFSGWNKDRTEKFNLMVNSQDYPDLLNFHSSDYIGGFDSYVFNEVIIDLAELIPQYAPRYTALREGDPIVAKDTVTDTGIIPAFFLIQQVPQPRWIGPSVRQDMLDQIGYDASEVDTYDELHDMLTAMKDANICEVAPFAPFTASGIANWFSSGFNAYNGMLNVDGKVIYSTASQEMKDYVILMNKWYNEGLIDPYFYSRVGASDMGLFIEASDILNDDFGYFASSYSGLDTSNRDGINENYELVPMLVPMLEEGQDNKIYYTGTDHRAVTKTMAISTQCENPEIAVRYIDYCYDEEMSTILNYGLEGSGRVTIDGKPYFSEAQLEDPDGINGNSYSSVAMWPMIYMWTREFTLDSSDMVYDSIYGYWNTDGFEDVESYTMPPVSLSTDESSTYANIINEVNTYAAETIVRMVIGEIDIETGWQEFLDTIDSMGIDEAVAIQQAALDRYNAR